MAYGLKYELLCTTIKGNLYKVKVFFDGYAGSQIDRNVPTSPFKLRKDKADYIRGTSLDYSIIEEVDFEFLEFYTNKNKFVKVELYDPSDTLMWVGYNLPQQYQTPYTSVPNIVSFTAADGLGLLKTESFTLSGFMSLLQIVIYCISKTGLVLGYSIAINMWATLHNTSRSPLEQTYIYSEAFAGLSCYDVLEDILKLFNAEITQSRGRWRITRSADKKSTRMLYSTGGAYQDTEAGPDILILGYPGTGIDVSPRGSLQMSLEPGGAQVDIKENFNIRHSIMLNSDFALYHLTNDQMIYDPHFENWNKIGDFMPVRLYDRSGSPYALIPFTGLPITMNQSIAVEAAPGQTFTFSVKVGTIYYNADSTPNAYGIKFKMMLSLSCGTDEYGPIIFYLVNNPIKFPSPDNRILKGWVRLPTPYYMEFTLTASSSGLPEISQIEVITDPLPLSGILDVNLCGPEEHLPYVAGETYFVAYQDLIVSLAAPGGTEVLAKFTNSTEPQSLPNIELPIAEGFGNAALIAKNCLLYADGTPIT
jgi:hypothetical protein